MEISAIDRNFAVSHRIPHKGLCFRSADEAPFRIYGVRRDGDYYRRLPTAVAEGVNAGVLYLHTNTAGGRVRFVTDSPRIAISAQMDALEPFSHMAYSGKVGFDLYSGTRYFGTFMPAVGMENGYEAVIEVAEPQKREYTVHLPLYANVKSLEIGICEGAVLERAGDYRIEAPVVFYGSSITQGGCASRPGNAYSNIISQRLGCDHLNLGFSGNAKGEASMAAYIAGLSMSAFVLDYDHNAPSPEQLAATHKPFYDVVRAAHPALPIVLLSRPKYYLTEAEQQRLAVVRDTYERAVAAGDKNIYFIPGPALIEGVQEAALVDNCHPNDVGFFSMARVVGDLLEKILLKGEY